MTSALRRTRMTPEARRKTVLDAAAAIVTREGVSAVTMERVAHDAGASKALVYSYFSNRTTLLAQLLLREYPAFRGPAASDAGVGDAQEPFAAQIARTTADYIGHVARNGLLLERLLGEPMVAAEVATQHSIGRATTAVWFGKRIARETGIERQLAERIADILMGVTGAAGRLVVAGDATVDEAAGLATELILSAIHGVAEERASAT